MTLRGRTRTLIIMSAVTYTKVITKLQGKLSFFATIPILCSVAQSCPTPRHHGLYSPPGSSVHGIFHAILQWIAISYSRGSSWPRGQTCVFCISCLGRWILYHSTTWEAPILHLSFAKRPRSTSILSAAKRKAWLQSCVNTSCPSWDCSVIHKQLSSFIFWQNNKPSTIQAKSARVDLN